MSPEEMRAAMNRTYPTIRMQQGPPEVVRSAAIDAMESIVREMDRISQWSNLTEDDMGLWRRMATEFDLLDELRKECERQIER